MNKTPMTFEQFEYYMNKIKEEMDYYDKCYKLGFDILENSNMLYTTIDLLSMLFGETEDSTIAWWVFECEFGTDKRMSATNDNKISFEVNKEVIYVDTMQELYNYLVRNYNGEFTNN